MRLDVTRIDELTPALRRVWFRSDDLAGFADSRFTDRYVKLVFLKPGVNYPEPLDVRALRGVLPPEDLPVVRTYTALFPDITAGSLAIDFVVHGDEGVAGRWAAAARPGDRLLANGPGGAYAPDPDADWHLLVGDESATPAITAALAALSADAVAEVVILVDGPAYELELPRPSGARVQFRHRAAGEDLISAVRELEWRPGRVQAFVHGEAQEVMHAIRPYLFTERALPRADVSISGYWRTGRTEEGFRAWKAELAQAETAV